MTASLKDIIRWFENGLKIKAAYMIVVCDSFDYEDYPHYVSQSEANDFWTHFDRYDNKNMQWIVEVYDLNRPWAQQSQTQGRVWNVPDKPLPSII